jgi:hypothetical protein
MLLFLMVWLLERRGWESRKEVGMPLWSIEGVGILKEKFVGEVQVQERDCGDLNGLAELTKALDLGPLINNESEIT